MLNFVCTVCGKECFDRKRGDRIPKYCGSKCYGISKEGKASWNKGIPMRKESKEKLSKARKGKHFSPKTEFKKGHGIREQNSNWKGGRHTMTNGYIALLQPHHPRASARGYVYEHILVAEKHLERFLDKGEVVHHINGNKTDNRPKNLYVFENNSEHLKNHHKDYLASLTSNVI